MSGECYKCTEHCLDCKCKADLQEKKECYIYGCRHLQTHCVTCGRVVCEKIFPKMNEWISVKDKSPPKDQKFLFSYYAGIRLAQWRQCYTTINGNIERTHEAFCLVLEPFDESEDERFEWPEDYLKYLDVYWMPLPKPPEKI